MATANLGTLPADALHLADEVVDAIRQYQGRSLHPALQVVLRNLLCAARSMAGTGLLVLGGSAPHNPHRVIASPPMARALLDCLFSTVFLLEKPETRLRRYLRSSWDNSRKDVARFRERFAGDPSWDAWLLESEQMQDLVAAELLSLGEDTTAPTAKRDRWPSPGQMAGQADDATQAFLTFLHQWFARELADHSHLIWNGLAAAAACVLQTDEEQRCRTTRALRMRPVTVLISLMLALLTVLNATFGFCWGPDLQRMWKSLTDLRSDAADLDNATRKFVASLPKHA